MRIKEEQEEPPILKKRKNVKGIGNSWERKFCKLLSKWVSPNTNDLLFWRSASSGAVATNRFKKKLSTKNMDGDITCLDSNYAELTNKIYFECKTVKSNEFVFWSSPKSNYLYSAVIDTFNVALNVNKLPFLAISVRNGKTPRLIVLPKEYALGLKLPHNYCTWNLSSDRLSFVVVKMDGFFENNTWKDLMNRYNEIYLTN